MSNKILSVEQKGKYKGRCNFSACESGKKAVWYHFSTQQYYCEDCAKMLNHENRKDAHAIYGHDLLIPIQHDALPEPVSVEELDTYPVVACMSSAFSHLENQPGTADLYQAAHDILSYMRARITSAGAVARIKELEIDRDYLRGVISRLMNEKRDIETFYKEDEAATIKTFSIRIKHLEDDVCEKIETIRTLTERIKDLEGACEQAGFWGRTCARQDKTIRTLTTQLEDERCRSDAYKSHWDFAEKRCTELTAQLEEMTRQRDMWERRAEFLSEEHHD